MYSRHLRNGAPWWLVLSLAALSILGSVAGARAQNPPGDLKGAAVETYQGAPVGLTAPGRVESHPARRKVSLLLHCEVRGAAFAESVPGGDRLDLPLPGRIFLL